MTMGTPIAWGKSRRMMSRGAGIGAMSRPKPENQSHIDDVAAEHVAKPDLRRPVERGGN